MWLIFDQVLEERLNSLLVSDCADGLKKLAIGFLLVFVTVSLLQFYPSFAVCLWR